MKVNSYTYQSFRYFAKQHLAVFFATILAAAVLTGALIVGDSVQMSLQKNVDQRLGKTQFALTTNDRFIRSQLADELALTLKTQTTAILNQKGSAIHSNKNLRHNGVNILGIDSSFWFFSSDHLASLKAREIMISQSLAQDLQITEGDRIVLKIQKTGLIPLNAPFTKGQDNSISLRLKVTKIIDKNSLGGFSLRNQQSTAFNVFINREYLAEELELKKRCNLILVEADKDLNPELLNQSLQSNWRLKDASLKINSLEETQQWELASDRVFLDIPVYKAAEKVAAVDEQVFTYFVNQLQNNNNSTPYSFVSALSNSQHNIQLEKNEIILNNWVSDDLNAALGDSIQLDYFVMGAFRKLEEKQKTFIVKEILNAKTPPFSSSLMPDFPGLSTAGNCSDWDAGIPIDLEKIRNKDEQYWDDLKGTPKAIIAMETAHQLWQNPFGDYTSIRFQKNLISKQKLETEICKTLSPKDLGLQFHDIRSQGKAAASNGVDFGQLFLSLSFFVIVAALILLVLIYQLQLLSRQSESGLLLALGFSKRKIIKLHLKEIFPVLFIGAIMGGFLGILYNQSMIFGLNHVWNQAVHTDILEAFVLPETLITGIISSIMIALISIIWVLIKQLKKTSIASIRNQNIKSTRKIHKLWPSILLFLLSFIMIFMAFKTCIDKNSGWMLAAGFSLMSAMIFLVSWLMNSTHNKAKYLKTRSQLSFLNAQKNKSRSLAIVTLLAIGTFTIIVTGANRKTFHQSENERSSGTGGFLFWAENSIPILKDLNLEESKKEFGIENEEALDSCKFIQFNSLMGDDASCLNLNQVQQPQILGVDAKKFDELKAFSFAQTLEKNQKPWLLLNKDSIENIIPAIADQTVIQWGLIKKLGDTLHYFNERGETIHLVLTAGLNASIFQGNILISKENFRKHFPSSAGSKFMLINGPTQKKEAIKQILSNQFADYGLELTETQTRLANFYSVTNTYLSIFMILGGLGVIIGTLGLGLIIWRNMLERKQELELMKSLGFPPLKIFKIVFIENLILVIIAILIGISSAFVGILPSLITTAFSLSASFIFYLVLAVLFSAILWIYLASRSVLRF